jgi:hypothetical protein
MKIGIHEFTVYPLHQQSYQLVIVGNTYRIMAVLKVETDIITCITTNPIGDLKDNSSCPAIL